MAYTPRDLTGSTFNNKKKEKDNHPDYNGHCQIDGKKYYLSGWIKTSVTGEPWVSWAYKSADEIQERAKDIVGNKDVEAEIIESDIPF